jgi:transcriptional regulator with XRE-family HTH domain
LSKNKKARKATKGRPTFLDVHFGKKLRARRLTMTPKLTQDRLAKALGVSFQQIQKYELGSNRISTATLVRLAAVLKVDVQYFFDELPTNLKKNKEIRTPALVEMSLAAHGPRLIKAFLNLKSDELRAAVADLATALERAG